MKSIKEIMVRAVILVCISDRCALEEKIIEGKRYKERELFDTNFGKYARQELKKTKERGNAEKLRKIKLH